MHGDPHLSNVLLRRDKPELAAFVDWEMCTVGDPLLDLGWMFICWPLETSTIAAGAARRTGRLASGASCSTRIWRQVVAKRQGWTGIRDGMFQAGHRDRGHLVAFLVGQASRDAGEALHVRGAESHRRRQPGGQRRQSVRL